jgi:putative N6-adenine-specific DNA methylase
MPARIWNEARKEAESSINNEDFRILASDVDGTILKTARDNAVKAGVGDYIAFQKLKVQEFSSKKRYGCIICNPPYGERLGEKRDVERLYRQMGEVFSQLQDWSYFILTAYPEFEKQFGRKADKNRKLYNGRLQCYYYQYLGPLPPKRKNVDNYEIVNEIQSEI